MVKGSTSRRLLGLVACATALLIATHLSPNTLVLAQEPEPVPAPKNDREAQLKERRAQLKRLMEAGPLGNQNAEDVGRLIFPLLDGMFADNDDDALRNLRQMQLQLLKQLQAEQGRMLRMMEQDLNNVPDMRRLRLPRDLGVMPDMNRAAKEPVRLGIQMERPSNVLAEQLELPNNQGMVIVDVLPDSPAAKAGLKKNDIVLEMAGKPVPSEPEDFRRAVLEIKADQPFEIVLLRKGRRETLKNVTLPVYKVENPPEAEPLDPAVGPIRIRPGAAIPGANRTSLRIFNNGFSISSSTGETTYQIEGRLETGPRPTKITIVEGDKTTTVESLDKVPDQHKENVERLLRSLGAR